MTPVMFGRVATSEARFPRDCRSVHVTRVLRDERGACLSRYGWPVCITLVVQGFRVSNCGGAVPELRGSLMAKNLCGCAGPSSRPSACVARSSGRNPHVSCWSTHPEHLSARPKGLADFLKRFFAGLVQVTRKDDAVIDRCGERLAKWIWFAPPTPSLSKERAPVELL